MYITMTFIYSKANVHKSSRGVLSVLRVPTQSNKILIPEESLEDVEDFIFLRQCLSSLLSFIGNVVVS